MKTLDRQDLHPDPLLQFARWFRAAQRCSAIEQADAFCLSTLSPNGDLAGRMVLLKGFDGRGFSFYTNFRSLKAKSVLAYPKAAGTFYWEALARQVRFVGRVERVTEEESDTYFRTRPRLSQLGAWASEQSVLLKSRAELDRRFDVYRKKFFGKEVPRPPHWGGFRIVPKEIEFWQARPNRLHDRFLYSWAGKRWKIRRLNP
ncbi:MAG TPA: pyridoxamine 5'-phosphate oxidase [Deltaproteobacteria bacterium]|nr:pyridoxamine 5'-phosphate oxidase [Deltaproteobacteria bacterium]